jgi:hydantoinase/carbamoylase family amidase
MITINKERLEKHLKALGQIGFEAGLGLNRPAYSENYTLARNFVEQAMKQAGMETRVDSVGNVFGVWKGTNAQKTILLGSHLDAVPNGGIYDGAMGVIAAVEAVQAIKEAGMKINQSLEVAGFTSEEGSELGGTFGSRSFVGKAAATAKTEVLRNFGLTLSDVEKAKGELGQYRCYLELHIEQGPVLWQRQIPIGIPIAIAGITRYTIAIHGRANHAGTTPMDARQDAMRETTNVLKKWYDFASAQHEFVSNIGVLSIFPGTTTIVPEKVEFILEIRAVDENSTRLAADTFREMLTSSCSEKHTMELLIEKQPVRLDSDLITMIETTCNETGIPYIKMPSGASHDASPIAHVMPTGMIFVPSVEGVSHSIEEYTPFADVCVGVDVLISSILKVDA